MDLPYYTTPAPFTQYYPNTTVPMHMVRQFQQNQGMLRPPFQDMFNPRAPAPPRYVPNYSMMAPNMYPAHAQPPMTYPGLTMPMAHMPNVIYPNLAIPPAQNYPPRAEPAPSYLSLLKSAVANISAFDALVKPNSTALSGPKVVRQPNSLTDVIVIADDTPSPGRKSRKGYELPSPFDPSLGQKSVFGDAYQPGPGQFYISKIRSLVEGRSLEDQVKFYHTYPRKSRQEAKSANPLPESQEEPPVERKKRRTRTKNPANGSQPKKPRSTSNSPTDLPPVVGPPPSQKYDLAYYSKDDSADRYPRPVSSNCQYLHIGSNGTTVPTSVYATIQWESAEKSARILLEFIYNGSLPTHNLDEDPNIKDIVAIVARKCFQNEEAVRTTIRNMCADVAFRSLRACPKRALENNYC